MIYEESESVLIELDNDFYDRIASMAEALDISPEEYLKRQHDSNANLKSVLLTEKDDFMKFIQEYKNMLDSLFYMVEDTSQILNKVDSPPDMTRVFSRLSTLVGEDVGFITKLYMVYKEKETIV